MPGRGSRRRCAEPGVEVPPILDGSVSGDGASGPGARGAGVRVTGGGGRPRGGGAAFDDGARLCDRTYDDRTSIFAKTKMCKFFILGTCTKGSDCRFAHFKEELSELPDLCRTKLCKTLIRTGRCLDSSCRYAHSKEELRSAPVVAEHSEARCGDRDAEQLADQSTLARCGPARDSVSAEVLAGHLLDPAQMASPFWVMVPAPTQDSCLVEGWPGCTMDWAQAAQWLDGGRPEAQAWLQEEDEPWGGPAGLVPGSPFSSVGGGTEHGSEQVVEQDAPPLSARGRVAHWPRMDNSGEAFSSSPLVVVKNTFLHVDTEKPIAALKQVSTWGGSLCAMECTADDETADGVQPDSRRGSSGGSDGE